MHGVRGESGGKHRTPNAPRSTDAQPKSRNAWPCRRPPSLLSSKRQELALKRASGASRLAGLGGLVTNRYPRTVAGPMLSPGLATMGRQQVSKRGSIPVGTAQAFESMTAVANGYMGCLILLPDCHCDFLHARFSLRIGRQLSSGAHPQPPDVHSPIVRQNQVQSNCGEWTSIVGFWPPGVRAQRSRHSLPCRRRCRQALRLLHVPRNAQLTSIAAVNSMGQN